MDWKPWFKIVLFSTLCVGCVREQVVQSIEEHKVVEGKVHANEVKAQSPFKKVEMDWEAAKNLMAKRNPKYRAAALGYVEACKETSVVKDFGGHVGSGFGNSLKSVASPDAIAKSLKSPISELPKQFESLSSLKNISHEMAQTAWEKKESEMLCRKQMRTEEVMLQVYFKKGELIDKHLAWAAVMKKGEVDPASMELLVKFEAKLKEDRKVWLNGVRDFFNAEYYDVQFRGESVSMQNYRKLVQPDFSDWKRWGALNRVEALAKVLKKRHKESKPMIPGTTVVKEKLQGMLNLEGGMEAELETREVRASIRQLIRSWREMKVAQRKIGELESGLGEGVDKKVLGKRAQLYGLEMKELECAKAVWLVDERCWSDA